MSCIIHLGISWAILVHLRERWLRSSLFISLYVRLYVCLYVCMYMRSDTCPQPNKHQTIQSIHFGSPRASTIGLPTSDSQPSDRHPSDRQPSDLRIKLKNGFGLTCPKSALKYGFGLTKTKRNLNYGFAPNNILNMVSAVSAFFEAKRI